MQLSAFCCLRGTDQPFLLSPDSTPLYVFPTKASISTSVLRRTVQKSLLPESIHDEVVQMPINPTTSAYSRATIIYFTLRAIAICSSYFINSPYYSCLLKEGTPFPGLTIFYASSLSVFGINVCDLVSSLHRTSSGSLEGVRWGAGLGAVAGAVVRILGFH